MLPTKTFVFIMASTVAAITADVGYKLWCAKQEAMTKSNPTIQEAKRPATNPAQKLNLQYNR